jgi:hypothetical protein
MKSISKQNSNVILHRNRKINIEIHKETQNTYGNTKPQIAKAILSKKSNA